MSQRIVAYEPSAEYRSVIDCLLDDDSYQVSVHETYDQLVASLREGAADLIIVSFGDLENGEAALSMLRQAVDTPILAFVQSADETKAALRSGADYDLPKPFDPEVFKVAVEAVLRRGPATTAPSLLPPPEPVSVQDLKVYP